jgi:hypothetical protein
MIHDHRPFQIDIDENLSVQYFPSLGKIKLSENDTAKEFNFFHADAERLYWVKTRIESMKLSTSIRGMKFAELALVDGSWLMCLNVETVERLELLTYPVDVELLIRIHLKDDNIQVTYQNIRQYIFNCVDINVEDFELM